MQSHVRPRLAAVTLRDPAHVPQAQCGEAAAFGDMSSCCEAAWWVRWCCCPRTLVACAMVPGAGAGDSRMGSVAGTAVRGQPRALSPALSGGRVPTGAASAVPQFPDVQAYNS